MGEKYRGNFTRWRGLYRSRCPRQCLYYRFFQVTVNFDPGPGVLNFISAGINAVFTQKVNPSINFMCAKLYVQVQQFLARYATMQLGI